MLEQFGPNGIKNYWRNYWFHTFKDFHPPHMVVVEVVVDNLTLNKQVEQVVLVVVLSGWNLMVMEETTKEQIQINQLKDLILVVDWVNYIMLAVAVVVLWWCWWKWSSRIHVGGAGGAWCSKQLCLDHLPTIFTGGRWCWWIQVSIITFSWNWCWWSRW